jgi:uncharacterized membrane protein
MMYWGDHMSVGGWIFSILATLIILAIIIGLIVWVVSPASRSSATTTGESAREILDRRLACGELTVEQYEQLREALNGPASTTSDLRPRETAGNPG